MMGKVKDCVMTGSGTVTGKMKDCLITERHYVNGILKSKIKKPVMVMMNFVSCNGISNIGELCMSATTDYIRRMY